MFHAPLLSSIFLNLSPIFHPLSFLYHLKLASPIFHRTYPSKLNYSTYVPATTISGTDLWGNSLKLLMGAVVGCGALIMAIMAWMQKSVLTDPECVPPVKRDAKKKKTKMSMGDSTKFLAKSPYIKDLAMMVIGYGMAINIVEVTWKSKLKAAFPDPNSYSVFMGNFSSMTGVVTLLMMIASRTIFKVHTLTKYCQYCHCCPDALHMIKLESQMLASLQPLFRFLTIFILPHFPSLQKFGWGVAALITPVTLLVTGAMFFSLNLFPAFFAPITARIGTTPLMLAVMVGAAQNILSKGELVNQSYSNIVISLVRDLI